VSGWILFDVSWQVIDGLPFATEIMPMCSASAISVEMNLLYTRECIFVRGVVVPVGLRVKLELPVIGFYGTSLFLFIYVRQ
jgi:hypothetical protein